MSALVAQHQQTSFATPINGAAGDATVVLGNDNATVSSYNAHDADATIHVQSSTAAVFAVTPAATAGRKWMTSDTGAVYLYYDTGSAWVEVNYLRQAASGAVVINVPVQQFAPVLTLTSASKSFPAAIYNKYGSAGTALGIASEGGTSANARLILVGAGTTTTSVVEGNSARGTLASPSAVQNGDLLLIAAACAYDGTAWAQPSGNLWFEASQTHTASAHGTRCVIQVTTNGSTTPTTAITIDNDLSATFAGTISATKIGISTAVARIVAGATSLSLRNNANSADNLLVTDAGLLTARNTFTGPTVQSGTATVSVNTATVTTVVTLPAVQGAVYLVGLQASGASAPNAGWAVVACGSGGSTFAIVTSAVGAGSFTTIGVTSGGAVQLTQTSGGTLSVSGSYLRIQ